MHFHFSESFNGKYMTAKTMQSVLMKSVFGKFSIIFFKISLYFELAG